MSKYDKYKESAFTHEEMQPMIIETDMTDIVERLQYYTPYGPITDMQADAIMKEAAAEIERLREALRYYAKNHYPDIDAGPWGPNSNDWGDVARSALGEKE